MFQRFENFLRLQAEEQRVRGLSLAMVSSDPNLVLHFRLMEAAMNVVTVFTRQPISSVDDEAIKLLSLRTFNMLASAQGLVLCGYAQNVAILGRDLLETVFLMDLFKRDPPAIQRWREAHTASQKAEFNPASVRKSLDLKDGFAEANRGKLYKAFCELAVHPTPRAAQMLRAGNGLAHGGPFYNANGERAVIAELGRLALQVGERAISFLQLDEASADAVIHFGETRTEWAHQFYPGLVVP